MLLLRMALSLNFFSHALLKKFQDTSLLGTPILCVSRTLFNLILAQTAKQGSIEIGVDHLWMYITFAADRFGVTKMPGGNFNGLAHVFFGFRLRLELPQPLQCLSSKNSARPGSEVFGCKILSRNLPQVFVDII